MAKREIVPVYVETERDECWEVYAGHPNGTLLGTVMHTTYTFPLNLFKPKGDYMFIPKFRQSPLEAGFGKTKEASFEKYLDLYCDAKVKCFHIK